MELTQMTHEIIQQFRTLSAILTPLAGRRDWPTLWPRSFNPWAARCRQTPSGTSARLPRHRRSGTGALRLHPGAIWTWSAPRPRGATTTRIRTASCAAPRTAG